MGLASNDAQGGASQKFGDMIKSVIQDFREGSANGAAIVAS